VAGVYFIKYELPFPVDDEKAVSRFKKEQHTLTITLPVVPPACIASIPKNQPMAAHLSSHSSVLSTTPPVVVTDPLLANASVTSSAPPSDSTTSDRSTPPIATTTNPVVVTDPFLANASVTSAEHKADIFIAPVAKCFKVNAVKSPIAKRFKVKAAHRLSFDGFNKCMESFKRIKWNVDVHRKDSPGAGKGIFCLRPIKKSNCVALYPGNLVDDKGTVVVPCPSTRSLFMRFPIVQRPFSRGHGVNVNSVACPHVLIVDGQFECAA
jgi:hypothetical protein